MAFGVEIRGLSATDDESLWTMEAWWWGARGLIDDPRFEDVSRCPGYRDFEAILSVDEARALAALYA
jgi:hypothetical protein